MTSIVVGSGNPVKIEAARRAFRTVFPDAEHELEGVAVPSGVPDQPWGREQAAEGARKRAAEVAARRPDADFWVGVEGGVEGEEELYAFARVVVRSERRKGESATGAFRLPAPVADRVRAGEELGAADDEVFGTTASKRDQGAVGLLTGGAVSRTELYAQGICLALTSFVHPELYGGDGPGEGPEPGSGEG